jgi:DNA-binding protein HU-beta
LEQVREIHRLGKNGKTPMKKAKKVVAAKVAAKSAKTAGKVETVTLKHLAAALAEAHDVPKKQATEMLTDMVTMIGKHLKKGMRVRMPGLGIMQVRNRPARMGRNPATGEAIKIKASKKVAFRVAKELKESI